jgi:hypothetical protein
MESNPRERSKRTRAAETPEDSFDPKAVQAELQETMAEFRRNAKASGLMLEKTSGWEAARSTERNLKRVLADFEKATTPQEQKALRTRAKALRAELLGKNAETIRVVQQEAYLAKPKRASRMREMPTEESHIERIDEALGKSNAAELAAFNAQRITTLRTELARLNTRARAGVDVKDSQILALENELHTLEETASMERRPSNAELQKKAAAARETSTARLQTKAEQQRAQKQREAAEQTRAQAESVRMMHSFTEDALVESEADAAAELERIRQESVLNEPEPTVGEARAKVDALKGLLNKSSIDYTGASAQTDFEIKSTPITAEKPSAGERSYSAPSLVGEGGALTRGPERKAEKKLAFEAPTALDVNFTKGSSAAEAKRVETLERAKTNAQKEKTNAAFKAESAELGKETSQLEQAYFAALRRSQVNRGFWDALGERTGFGKSRNDDPSGQVAALRRGWVEARAERARHMLDSVDARREGRGTTKERVLGKDGKEIELKSKSRQDRNIEAVRARYQRMFVVKDAVFGAEEREQKVRLDALNGRDKTIGDKLMKSKVARAIIGGVGVGAATVGAAAAFSGGAWVLGGLAAASAGTALVNTGYALAGKKGPTWGKWLSPGGIGGMWGRMFGRKVEKRTLQGADMTLSQRNVGDLRNANSFSALSAERQKAANEKEKAQSRIGGYGAVGAVAVGAATGAALGALDHGGAFGHHGGSAGHGGHSSEGGHGHALGGGHEGPQALPPDPIAKAHGGFTAEITHRGEGADLLFKDLRGQLSEAYKGHTPPPVVEKLLSYKSLDQLSHETGFENFPNSAVMHMHDKFTISPDGHTVSFVSAKDPLHPTVLMQETPQHAAAVQSQQEGWTPMRDYTHHAPRTYAEAARPEVTRTTPAHAETLPKTVPAPAPATSEVPKSVPAPTPDGRAPGVQSLDEFKRSQDLI